MSPLLLAAVLSQKPWVGVDGILGRPGDTVGALHRITFYRTDLQIQNSSGMLIPPEMGLVSSASFEGDPARCAVDGEVCVTANEIDPVIDDFRKGDLAVTALDHRFAGEQPGVYFLRFSGNGEAVALAKTVKSAFDELGKDRLVREGLQRTGHPPVVDWKTVAAILGQPVTEIGSSHVMRAVAKQGFVAFGGCPCGRTMISGEVAAATHLQPVIDALRLQGIGITRIEGSTVDFEGEGEAQRLATGVRAAWDASSKATDRTARSESSGPR